MRLAVIDPHDNVLIAWPAVADAHSDLGDLLAARVHPGRLRGRRRARLAQQVREHLLELQEQTRRL